MIEASTDGSQSGNGVVTSAVFDAYAKMLTIFIPLLVDEVIVLPALFVDEVTCILVLIY